MYVRYTVEGDKGHISGMYDNEKRRILAKIRVSYGTPDGSDIAARGVGVVCASAAKSPTDNPPTEGFPTRLRQFLPQ